MNSDGSNQINLTNGSGGGYVWSPDGSKIAFVSESDIWVMNSDGSSKINLTNKPGDFREYVWSPDGSKIAFLSVGEEDNFDMLVMNADGSNLLNLTGIK
jgi:TolB protein